MTIEDRNLKPGTVLVAKYKGVTSRCDVVEVDGAIRYKLGDGTLYKSPSAVGSLIRGGKATNGWAFWSVEGEEQPKAERKAKGKNGSKIIKCDACGKAYMTAEQLAHHTANAERLCQPHQGNGQAAQQAEPVAVA